MTQLHKSASLATVALAMSFCGQAWAQDRATLSPEGGFDPIPPVFIVNQTDENNVAGVVQTSPGASSDIVQTGFYNRAAVAQSGANPTASIDQLGDFNRALIVQQQGTTDADIIQGDVFNVGISIQTGAANSSTISQNGDENDAVQLQGLNDQTLVAATLDSDQLETLVENFLFAPETLLVPVELAERKALGFNADILSRLNARTPPSCETIAADLPEGEPLPVELQCRDYQFFAGGNWRFGDQDNRMGALGFDYDIVSAMVGVEKRILPGAYVGVALQYASGDAEVNDAIDAEIDMDSFQFGLFGDIRRHNWFVSGVVGFGLNYYDIDRPGFDGRTTGDADGHDISGAIQAGYLFDTGLGALQIGPIGGLTAATTEVDGYEEDGDPLLAQTVSDTSRDAIVGSVGLQVRNIYRPFGLHVSTFTDVTVEKDFGDDDFEVIESGFVAFPDVTIRTPVDAIDEDAYLRVASGFTVEIAANASATFRTDGTFFNDDRDSRSFGGEIGIRF